MYSLTPKRCGGMTIMELMVAIGILMLVLGLTISGVMKASEAAKQRRVDVMREAIYSAITAFRQNEGYWPGLNVQGNDTLKKFSKNNNTYAAPFNGVGFGGRNTVLDDNSAVLKAFEGKTRQYLDPSAVMVRKKSNKEVSTWRSCREKDGLSGADLFMVEGPPTKDSQGKYTFRYFVIVYNLDNDSVEVLRDKDMSYLVDGGKYENNPE